MNRQAGNSGLVGIKVRNWVVGLSFIFLVFLPESSLSISSTRYQTGWSVLERVQYLYAWSDEFEMEVLVPSFPPSLEKLEGSLFTLSGFYIPAELGEEKIFLSKEPYTSCFFCGGSGPETVAEVEFEGGTPSINVDALVAVRGTLRLNTDDYSRLFFIIEDAQLID
ncbi:MAG: hypothetical protein AAFQ98_00980 [Bacteroidota bacterium]